MFTILNTMDRPETTILKLNNNFKKLNDVVNIDCSTTINITDSFNKRFVSDAEKTILQNTSGTNTGDETANSIKSKLGITTISGANTGDQDLSGLVPTTRTINSHALTENITLTASDIGLGNCDNTHDADKPISTAVQTALNGKENMLTKGNLAESGSSILTITGGTSAIIGTGTSIQVNQANTSQSGYISSTDWNTFNNKLSSFTETDPVFTASAAHSILSSDITAWNGKQNALGYTPVNKAGDSITGALNVFFRLHQSLFLQRLKSIVTTASDIKRVIFFDETGATTVLKDRSTNLQNAALSASASTLNPNIVETCRILNFSGNNYWEFADADDLSFGNSTTETPYSLIALLNPSAVSAHDIIAKMDRTTGVEKREYEFCFYNNNLYFEKYDNSTAAKRGTYSTVNCSGDTSNYHTYIATDSGGTVNTTMNIYRDGALLDHNSDDLGASYVAMENLSAKSGNYRISTGGAKERISTGNYGLIAIISEALTASQIKDIDSLLRTFVGLDAAYL